ncbi:MULTISPECIES: DUF3108 domain-containing protein [Bacteroides]|uniref:DUF3108 domain-containing protein n=1 Tax=Bacteroides TaxID=816 RepID=UPI001D45ABBE|nr:MULTISPECIES: DUF3108 domain-containing protein [Bacteroides]HJD93115.1 DUF3108 domain-containing protein [Bacteroides coprosuis]
MMTRRKKQMKNVEGGGKILTLLAILLLLCINLNPINAQCKIKNIAMVDGEEITYDLYFHWSFVWKKAGDAIFTTKSTTYKGTPSYKMELLASSNKSADVFFKMRDTLTCIVSNDLEPLYFRKGAEEGKRFTVDEAKYSYTNNQVIVDQSRTWKDGRRQDHHFESDQCVYDMLSILAKARSINPENYKSGDRINFPMATGRRIDDIILEFRGTENIKTENRTTFRCIVFALIEKDKKKKEKDLITFYISDDNNHLPIKLKFNLNFGSAQVTLKTIKGQKYPLQSIVK